MRRSARFVLKRLSPVAQVARRYAMNANLIFNWLKKPRYQPEELANGKAVFLPVEVSGDGMTLPDSPARYQTDARMVIELAGRLPGICKQMQQHAHATQSDDIHEGHVIIPAKLTKT